MEFLVLRHKHKAQAEHICSSSSSAWWMRAGAQSSTHCLQGRSRQVEWVIWTNHGEFWCLDDASFAVNINDLYVHTLTCTVVGLVYCLLSSTSQQLSVEQG